MFLNTVRFKVLMAVTMEITVFWDVTPCSLWIFRGVSENYLEEGNSTSLTT
jgi:hypothetical protein